MSAESSAEIIRKMAKTTDAPHKGPKVLLEEIERLKTERNNAEKREYEVLGRVNALEKELKATQARLDISDKLLREEFAQRGDRSQLLPDELQQLQEKCNEFYRVVLEGNVSRTDS